MDDETSDPAPRVVGFCDGIDAAEIYGWAWRPDRPDETVDIELWIGDALVAGATACEYRPDLRSAGIGHGRYGWRIPLPPGLGGQVTGAVRVKGGGTLPGGDSLLLKAEADSDGVGAPELEAFVAAVLGRRGVPQERPAEAAKPTHFLLHAPKVEPHHAAGASRSDYAAALDAFQAILPRIGEVRIIDGAEAAERIYLDHVARGELTILLVFAPPHHTTLGLRCPVIPVFGWGFPHIPLRVWSEDRRHDWRFVLRQTGRAIALSDFTARAVRTTLGEDFPVAVAPYPAWRRFSGLYEPGPRPKAAPFTVRTAGAVYESAGKVLDPEAAPLPPPQAALAPAAIELEGTVFCAVVDPVAGAHDWEELLSAFVVANRDRPDATLVLWMRDCAAADWWTSAQILLNRQPPFVCKAVIFDGALADPDYRTLIRASDWIVSASQAEGFCPPLMDFMSAGRPAICASHTALAEFVSPSNALIVEAREDYAAFPHDPSNAVSTVYHRASWPSLVAQLAAAGAISETDPDRYYKMAEAASGSLKAYCDDEVAERSLRAFLGLTSEAAPAPALAEAAPSAPA